MDEAYARGDGDVRPIGGQYLVEDAAGGRHRGDVRRAVVRPQKVNVLLPGQRRRQVYVAVTLIPGRVDVVEVNPDDEAAGHLVLERAPELDRARILEVLGMSGHLRPDEGTRV